MYVPRAVRVTVTYMDTLIGGYGWSGRQYMYVPRAVRVTVTYMDTLIGAGSTCTFHVLSELL